MTTITLMKALLVFFIPLLCCWSLYAQDEKGFSLTQSRQIHQAFKKPIQVWSAGGDLTRYVFLNMSEFWEHALIRQTGPVRQLEEDFRADVSNARINSQHGESSLDEYVHQSPTDGVIILSKGKIVYESYPRMSAQDLHVYWSISKTFVATIIGLLEERNQIDVAQPIEHYLDELTGSAWEGVPVLDILDMASGIDCREHEEGAFSDPATGFFQYFQAIGFPSGDAALQNPIDVFTTMKKLREPGKIFEYSSANTTILTFLIERITGKRFKEVLEQEIWQRLGAEQDALILTTPSGQAASFGGISATLRDLARYGLLYTPSGRKDKQPLISDQYLDKIQHHGRATIAQASDYWDPNDEPWTNTYQWDRVMQDGDFYKAGFGGQGLYISPAKDLVIAYFGSQNEAGESNELEEICRQLALSGIFE